MADAQRVMGRRVPRAEAGSAESRTDQRPGLDQLLDRTGPRQCEGDRLARRIDAQRERPVSDRLPIHDFGHDREIVEGSAGASGHNPLVCPETPPDKLVRQPKLQPGVLQKPSPRLLDLAQDIPGISIQFRYRPGVARVERQRNHRGHFSEIHLHDPVVPADRLRLQRAVILGASVDLVPRLHPGIRPPDRGEAGRLRRHHVDPVAEIDRQVGYPRADELQHLVFHPAPRKQVPDDRQRHVLGPDPGGRLPLEKHRHHLRPGQVIGFPQELLDDLRSPLPDSHRPQRSVTGVAVRCEDHPAAAGHGLPEVLVNHRLVRGNEYPSILSSRRQAEQMVVPVDGPSHGAQAVVAVRQDIRHREGLHPAGPGRLDDPHIGDVVRRQRIETDLHDPRIFRPVVCGKNPISHGSLPGFSRVDLSSGPGSETRLRQPTADRFRIAGIRLLHDQTTPQNKSALFRYLYHRTALFLCMDENSFAYR